MDERSITIEEFNQIIRQWYGKTVQVTTQDGWEPNSAFIKLDDVTVSPDNGVIQLHGEPGESVMEASEHRTSTHIHEIPIIKHPKILFDDAGFTIQTASGTIKIDQINDVGA
ncbi:hypothetical protein [Thalassobacillus hwangdonensis]|uniref:Uncharacterized protein n=1 Tax=Thalassobacillus hwangdonensis TaxID=546108 RepID=A0ABW3L3B7_9BACI